VCRAQLIDADDRKEQKKSVNECLYDADATRGTMSRCKE
jgi:hypothetical protein